MAARKSLIVALVMLAVASLVGAVQAQPPLPDGVDVVASGFNGPQGLLVDADGSIWVIDSGLAGDEDIEITSMETGELVMSKMGNTARIVKVTPDGEQTVVATLPSVALSENEMVGGGRLALLDGVLYATSGGWNAGITRERLSLAAAVVRVEADGTTTEVANIWDIENADNPDGTILDTHPYGLTAGPDGWLYIADAGGNDVLRVNPADGTVELVAAFSEGFPGGFPNPARGGAVEADPVPTAVVFDDGDNLYVSFLSGAPFIPGTAKVVKITPEGDVSDFATGLTTLTDMTLGPDGQLYAVSFGLFTEQGPDPTTGAVVRITAGDASEVVVSGLPFPTSIDFDADGSAYVTIWGVGAPGSGAVVRIDGLTGMPGQPVTQG